MTIKNKFKVVKFEVTFKLDGATDQDFWHIGSDNIREILADSLNGFITPDVSELCSYTYQLTPEVPPPELCLVEGVKAP